jgi:hypothetical protein
MKIMHISTKHILIVLYILSWLIFVGVSIEAGGFISNSFYALVINSDLAKHFWSGLDFSALYDYDKGQFMVITIFMSIVAVLRAVMFYLIIRFLHNKKGSMTKPFNEDTRRFVLSLAIWSLFIGVFSHWGVEYRDWLTTKGIAIPEIQSLRLAGADVWLFMAVILFVITHVFKKGIELQTESELTV